MNLISVVAILLILLGGVMGFKKGVIKTGVGLVGTISVLIISYVFKDYVANFLMKYLPFFNFGGIFNGISSINILMYEMLSFIVIFIVLYCLLNILLTLSGLIEKILKLTVVLAIPSKILGCILGLVEGIVVSFLVCFVLLHFPQTEEMVMDSKVAIVILERTPFVSTVALRSTKALEEINNTLNDAKNEDDREQVNIECLHYLITYKVIDKEDVNKLIESDKLHFEQTIKFE